MKQYFSQIGRDDLQEQIPANVISEKEAIAAVAREEHKKLHKMMNELRVLAGMEEEEYTEPDLASLIKPVYEKYEKVVPPTEEEVIQMFSACGSLKSDYHIIKTKPVKFNSDFEAFQDETVFFTRMNFKQSVTISEARILELIKKDPKITPEVLAKALKTTAEYITGRIAALTKAGLLESSTVKVGEDEHIERKVTKPLKEIEKPDTKNDVVVEVKYSYEGPQDDRNRPFCAMMLKLDRLYSRAEIERISLRLGYSVFDRRGGWWTKPNGTKSPSCRHKWQSNVIVKKRKP